jgi:hypothetical protein
MQIRAKLSVFLYSFSKKNSGCSWHLLHVAQFQRNGGGRSNICPLHTVQASYLQAYATDYNEVDRFQIAVKGRR